MQPLCHTNTHMHRKYLQCVRVTVVLTLCMCWLIDMACGINLGILLILVQAEHVCCSWATQAHISQRQNSNTYVGFSQQDSGVTRLGSSYPQNKFRQASSYPGLAQGSSFNPEPAVSSSSNQGLSKSSHTPTTSKPGQKGYSSVRFVQANSLSKPNWAMAASNKVNAPKTPEKPRFGLSTSIASGSSVSKYGPVKKSHTDISPRSWPAEQGTQHTGQYLSSSSASVQSPSRERNYFMSGSHQSAAQKSLTSPAKSPAFSAQGRSIPSVQSASLFRSNSYVPNSIQRRTSATAPARRVSSRSAAAKRSRFPPTKNERPNDPSQTGSAKSYQSKLFPVNERSAQGNHNPTPNMASSVSYPQASYKQNSPVVFAPRSLHMPANQRFNNKPSSTSSIGQVGRSSRRFAPTKLYSIPEHFGGFAIKRLREPADQKVVQKPPQQHMVRPQQHTVRPQKHALPTQQTEPYNPQGQGVHQKSRWLRVRPGQQVQL